MLKDELQKKHCAAIEDAEYEEIKHSAIYKLDFDKAAAACTTITLQTVVEVLEGMKVELDLWGEYQASNYVESKLTEYTNMLKQK